MKTSTLAKVGRVGVPALALLALASCGHSSPNVGNVELLVTVPSDVAVNALDFRVTAASTDAGADGSADLASGHIRTARPQEEFSQLVTHVPVAENDSVEVDAKSVDGLMVCTGSASLRVRKGQTTRVHIALFCRGLNDGVVHIVVGIACPVNHLVSLAVSPLAASVGATIDVAAIDEEPDAGMLKYLWLATSGAFAEPSAAATTYRCTTPGPVRMTLVLIADGCQDTRTIDVTCAASADAGAPDADAGPD